MCSFFECKEPAGPGSIRVLQDEKEVAVICEKCLAHMAGAVILLKTVPGTAELQLNHIDLLDTML